MTLTEPAHRYQTSAQATSDTKGQITLVLGPPPLGFAWKGQVAVLNPPASAQFQASTFMNLGKWVGSTPFGTITLYPGESLTVVGTGLVQSTVYTLAFEGTVEDASTVVPEWPQPATIGPAGSASQVNRTDPLTNGQLLVYGQFSCGDFAFTQLHISTTAGRLLVQLDWANDPALDIRFGSKLFVVGAGLTADPLIPNLGPYVSLSATQSVAGSTVLMQMNQTNGNGRPRWNPISDQPIIDAQSVLVSNGATVNQAANYCYGGEAYVQTWTDAAAWVIEIDGTDENGVSHMVYRTDQAENSSTSRHQRLLVPAMDLVAKLTNGDGVNRHLTCTLIGDLYATLG